MKRVLILGATSAIAIEVARCYAAEGASLVLAARNGAHLETVRGDLMSRGAKAVATIEGDLAALPTIDAAFDQALKAFDGLDVVFLAYGILGNPADCRRTTAALQQVLEVNFTSAACWLSLCASYFERERRGTIAAIGSVAGDRGRKSNYEYGASKAALERFLQGLRNRLFSHGVRVVTIKPGFVDTPMTSGFKKGPLFASAELVGSSIYKSLSKPSPWSSDVVYVPWFWRFIMLIISHIPEVIFKRLSL